MGRPLARRVATALALAAAPIAALSAPAGPSTARGVYTEAQAQEGAALYAGQCAMCHGRALEGTYETPALVGGRFLHDWAGPLGALTAYVHRAMPQMAPGTLPPEDVARVTAFLLKANGMPAGATPLPAEPEKLKAIGLEAAGKK